VPATAISAMLPPSSIRDHHVGIHDRPHLDGRGGLDQPGGFENRHIVRLEDIIVVIGRGDEMRRFPDLLEGAERDASLDAGLSLLCEPQVGSLPEGIGGETQ